LKYSYMYSNIVRSKSVRNKTKLPLHVYDIGHMSVVVW
jgi:hypothetical protein